ncbi:hypothetical protein [Haloplanus aerogenes]|uniref:Uncharacterized protein n=1 Tax=Haloplanus aerogenes TaxID=660522 RepID=A0A3M0E0P5_9EURY|nr:hypothetical protein [Haloplanus aerogenes]AZH25788.1 hypothetical protein DU502_10540 [Haloplanus aerogenes]RMB25526.1 hypothetical protein ATH50_0623 [Haloplanus aerogenes]
MPQLRSCYFCGAVGDSLREYEVVPERLVSPSGTRSAVLCSTCHEKLRRVLEPLVEAAESSSGKSGRGISSIGEVTFESAETADTDGAADGKDDADETTPDIEVTNRDTAADEESTGADTDGDDADGADTDEDVPDGYYKVLRLLQNREFPMERTDLTALVTGAYDVSEPQCERILEVAIDRGVLVEDGSTLDIGRN